MLTTTGISVEISRVHHGKWWEMREVWRGGKLWEEKGLRLRIPVKCGSYVEGVVQKRWQY